MTSDHQLASQSSVTREEIRRYPYVCYDDESSRSHSLTEREQQFIDYLR